MTSNILNAVLRCVIFVMKTEKHKDQYKKAFLWKPFLYFQFQYQKSQISSIFIEKFSKVYVSKETKLEGPNCWSGLVMTEYLWVLNPAKTTIFHAKFI